MRRDMDLVRALLLFAETNVPGGGYARCEVKDFQNEFPNLDKDTLRGHVKLLRDAGYFGRGGDTLSSIDLDDLTWSGQEFLDSIRDPKVWAATKAAGEKAGGWTLQILSEVAKAIIKQQIKSSTGIDL